MKQPSPFSLIVKGLFSAGAELTRSLMSPRALNGLRYSLYQYPFSPVFRKVADAKDGVCLPGGMCVVYNSRYGVPMFGLEGLAPFDTHRFAQIYERLVADKIMTPATVFVPAPASDEDLLLVHSEEYLSGLADPGHTAQALELAFIAALPRFAVQRIVSAYRYVTGGTILAAHLALENGLAVNLGGGLHHARPHRGGGFCLFADIPVAIRKIKKIKKRLKVLVIDLDVHQGDGTIACMQGDKSTYTFSIHQSEIYPFPKEVGDLDVEIFSGTDDDEYLSLLKKHLPVAFAQSRPNLVFYIAGADALAEDPLASVELSVAGLIQRDQLVLETCKKHGVPMAVTLGGGYSGSAWQAQYESIRNLMSG